MALALDILSHAIEAAEKANFNPHPPIWYYYIPQLTEVKLLFYTGEEEMAFKRLEDLIITGRSCHNENLLIQALTLKAVLLENSSDHDRALNVLNEALSLSKNSIRTFLDHGTIMRQLIHEISKDQTESSQIRELEQAFLNSVELRDSNKVTKPGFDITTLSKRELEILNLVIQGYKNDEIADQLFVSLDTIKKHLYNAYQKLDVSNRIRAIKKVQELGLLT